MAVIRLRALECLGATIARLCPELNGNICVGQAEHPKKQQLPHLSIIPARWDFFPDQDGDIHAEIGETVAVFNVGQHVATVQLRVGARNSRVRAKLEHGISQIFVMQEHRPGVLLINLADCHDALVAFELDSTEWENDLAFDKEFYSIIVVETHIPALVERGGVYTIDEIRSCLTEDMNAYAEIPASAIDCVAIDENGNITASTPTL